LSVTLHPAKKAKIEIKVQKICLNVCGIAVKRLPEEEDDPGEADPPPAVMFTFSHSNYP